MAQNPREFAVLTRSLFEVFSDVASQISVPEEDVKARRVLATTLEQGLTNPELPSDRFGQPPINIRATRDRPEGAAVAVRHRGWWFSISDADVRSKRLFGFLLLLYGLAEGQGTTNTHIITVPAK